MSWDDNGYVIHNQAAHGFSAANLRTAFSSYYIGNYAPIQIVSYMLDYTLWGFNAFGYRLTNLILHIANALMLFLLVKECEGSRATALLAALIFLCHPVQVETVAWISQRKNVLSLFFFLLSLLLYIRFRTSENRRISYFAVSLVAFVCALLSKSVAVILPFILFAFDICILRERVTYRMILEKLPFLMCAAACALLAIFSQSAEYGGGRTGYHGGSLYATMLSMFPVYVDYFRMILWPAGLSAFYDVPIRKSLDWITAASAAGVLVFMGLWFTSFRNYRHIFFWGAVFILGILPVSQIIPIVTLKNDRYLYFPLLGASPVLAVGAIMLYDRMRGYMRILWLTAVVCVLFMLAIHAHRRTLLWDNHLSLWEDAVAKNPGSLYVWEGLAEAYHFDNRYEEARQAYFRALGNAPSVQTLHNLAILYQHMGNTSLSVQILEKMVVLHPTFVPGYVSLGKYYISTGAFDSARDVYEHLGKLPKEKAKALLGLALVELTQGNITEAESRYAKILEQGVNKCDVYYGMASIESLRGNTQKALEYLEKSFQEGFLDFGALMSDENLKTARNSSAFKTLVKKYYGKELP